MSDLTRRGMIAGGLSALVSTSARSNQGWPDRPVTVVHGFPPGGTVDLVARIVADGLSKRLGQPIIVEGRPGASGTMAAAQVARAAPKRVHAVCHSLRARRSGGHFQEPSVPYGG